MKPFIPFGWKDWEAADRWGSIMNKFDMARKEYEESVLSAFFAAWRRMVLLMLFKRRGQATTHGLADGFDLS